MHRALFYLQKLVHNRRVTSEHKENIAIGMYDDRKRPYILTFKSAEEN
jgi:hypothetical protein